MYGWAGHLRTFLYETDREFIALLPSGENGAYELKKYMLAQEGWQAEDGKQAFIAAGLSLEEIIGQAALEIARKGWHKIPVLFVLPEEEILGYALQLPADLNMEEQQEAAYWEFDDKLLARGLSAENFACICQPMEINGGQCTIMGVRHGYLQEVEQAFVQAELSPADIIPPTGGAQNAVLSYLRNGQRETAGFKHRRGERLAIRHILSAWLGMLALACSLLLVFDICHYKQNQSRALAQEQELMRLSAEQSEMEIIEARAAAIDTREKLLMDISRQGISWYSLLVHLGTNTTEGVNLTALHLSADGGQLFLEGQAVSYDALAEFLGQLEADRDVFAQGVKLDNALWVKGQAGTSGRLNFSVSVDWKSGRNGKDSGEVNDNLS